MWSKWPILDVTEFRMTYKLKHTKSPGLKPLGLDPWYHPVDGPYLNLIQIDLWRQKWPHQGFTRAWSILTDTYSLEVLNKNSGERSRVTWPYFSVCNTWYDFTEHDKCCFHFIWLLYIRHFYNKTLPWYLWNSITYISQNIPEYKNVSFLGKKENIFAGFISKHDRIYVRWIMQHQI